MNFRGPWESVLLEDYDRRHRVPSGLTELDLLRHLVEESGMSVVDLGRVLGSHATASLLLAGKRKMSKAVMLRLAEHFAIDPGLFLRGRNSQKAA